MPVAKYCTKQEPKYCCWKEKSTCYEKVPKYCCWWALKYCTKPKYCWRYKCEWTWKCSGWICWPVKECKWEKYVCGYERYQCGYSWQKCGYTWRSYTCYKEKCGYNGDKCGYEAKVYRCGWDYKTYYRWIKKCGYNAEKCGVKSYTCEVRLVQKMCILGLPWSQCLYEVLSTCPVDRFEVVRDGKVYLEGSMMEVGGYYGGAFDTKGLNEGLYRVVVYNGGEVVGRLPLQVKGEKKNPHP
ncbi:MAG: hypothetical protein J7L38_00365 [Thermoproteales archaeon]|nr:hypothetical protein [Thermoproteales archaeon]